MGLIRHGLRLSVRAKLFQVMCTCGIWRVCRRMRTLPVGLSAVKITGVRGFCADLPAIDSNQGYLRGGVELCVGLH